MKIHGTTNSDWPWTSQCEYGNFDQPYILYSKGLNRVLLSKSQVSLVAKWDAPTGNDLADFYTLSCAEAENFCETHLKVPVITFTVNDARINQSYQCSIVGWMPGPVCAFPMNEVQISCGNPIGMTSYHVAQHWYPADTWTVYCKPDQNMVGEADSMVIPVNI